MCSSPVTDSIETEIENHERIKFGNQINGSWICNDCMAKRADETNSMIEDDDNSIHQEHIRDASKSDVFPNTPSADEADI